MHGSQDEPPQSFEARLWKIYRDFFDQAERRRRWSLEKDIPWEQCNRQLAPAIADVVESFCLVELYLPDYLGHAIPRSRDSRARSWFYFNWGYEESKHSLALEDWLVKSGARSDEQMSDVHENLYKHPWEIPHDNPVALLAYAMVQERATALNYRNLKQRTISKGGDPALEKLLTLLSVDEQAHHSFFRDCIRLHLERDRSGTLEQLRRVMNDFAMPAIHALADGVLRVARIRELDVFSESQYYESVYLPTIESLGVSRSEMRNKRAERKSTVLTP